MNIADKLSTLLPGINITEDFVNKLTAIIENAVSERVDGEIQYIIDKADQYSDYVNEEYNKLVELAEDYSDYANDEYSDLIELTEDYSDYTANKYYDLVNLSEEYSEYANDEYYGLMESAEDYSDYVINEMTDVAENYADYVLNEVTEKVDDYCDYIVEEFIDDNIDKFVPTEEYNRMSNVLRNIKESFEVNYFQLNSSDNPVNLELSEELDTMSHRYDKLYEEYRSLKNNIEEYSDYIESENKNAILEELTEGLADTQREKVYRLASRTRFEDVDSFRDGVEMMVTEMLNNNNRKGRFLSETYRHNNVTDNTTESDDVSVFSLIPEPNQQNFEDRMRLFIDKL